MAASVAPVIARIAITPAEYAELRKAAIDEGTTTSKLLAKIVRQYLPTEEARTK